MPEQYLKIKASLKRRGYGDKEAKRIAAATYNARHPGHAMHPHHKKQKDRRDVRWY